MKIIDLSEQKSIPVIVQVVENKDFKSITKREFFFKWEEFKDKAEIFKLTMPGKQNILGLVELFYIDSEYTVGIKLLAVSKANKGKHKQFEGIAGCLITYAARTALRLYGAIGCVSLIPKTELRLHYINKYNMKPVGLQVCLEGPALFDLISTYET